MPQAAGLTFAQRPRFKPYADGTAPYRHDLAHPPAIVQEGLRYWRAGQQAEVQAAGLQGN